MFSHPIHSSYQVVSYIFPSRPSRIYHMRKNLLLRSCMAVDKGLTTVIWVRRFPYGQLQSICQPIHPSYPALPYVVPSDLPSMAWRKKQMRSDSWLGSDACVGANGSWSMLLTSALKKLLCGFWPGRMNPGRVLWYLEGFPWCVWEHPG